MAAGGHFEQKIQTAISLQNFVRFTFYIHRPYFALGVGHYCIMTVDGYDGRLDTYFARERVTSLPTI